MSRGAGVDVNALRICNAMTLHGEGNAHIDRCRSGLGHDSQRSTDAVFVAQSGLPPGDRSAARLFFHFFITTNIRLPDYLGQVGVPLFFVHTGLVLMFSLERIETNGAASF